MNTVQVDAKRNIFEGKPVILKIGDVDNGGTPYDWSFAPNSDDEYWTVPELKWLADFVKNNGSKKEL